MISTLGDQAAGFYKRLVPIVTYLVRSFDEPESDDVVGFWQKIMHHHPLGSGNPDMYSGWVTAFSYWDECGGALFGPGYEYWYEGWKNPERLKLGDLKGPDGLPIDDVEYHCIRTRDLVQGFVTVKARVDDTFNGNGVYMVQMTAGSVGTEFSASGDHGEALDTVEPLSGWFVHKLPEESRTKKKIMLKIAPRPYRLKPRDGGLRVPDGLSPCLAAGQPLHLLDQDEPMEDQANIPEEPGCLYCSDDTCGDCSGYGLAYLSGDQALESPKRTRARITSCKLCGNDSDNDSVSNSCRDCKPRKKRPKSKELTCTPLVKGKA